MRYKLTVQYDGKNYSGSQRQPDRKTIQGELEKTISTLTNQYIKTIFSGRTDAGVSALGQVVHFDIPYVIEHLQRKLNELLPDDIRVSDLKEVDEGFHAQKSAKLKHYRYEGVNELGVPLKSLARMQKALHYLTGEHDFASFKCAGTSNPYTDCFIESAVISQHDDKVIVDIIGNRFLYKMIRTIIGTLLMIEKQNLDAEAMKEILEAKDRSKAGKTVTPAGLTLVGVQY